MPQAYRNRAVTISLDRVALHQAYREGLDPADVVAACRSAAGADRHAGVFLAASAEQARAALAGLGPFDPEAKPLWGLPFAIKDNIDLAGVPTTAACPAFAATPDRSATAVDRLIAAGAIPIGKTNLDQFATGLVGVRTPYGAPKNSFDPAIVPGGSSSGSAVAVAEGLASFALGTDTAGSGRVPAGLNNLVGLKPTLGAVPVRGVVPACQTLDCVSVFALTVEDAWAVASAMAGYDAADPWSRRVSLGARGPVPPQLRAGVPDAASRRFFGDAAAERAFDRALELYAGLGIALVPVDFSPLFAVASLLYEGACVAERYAAIRPFIAAHRDALHPTTARIILGAEAPVGRRRLRRDLPPGRRCAAPPSRCGPGSTSWPCPPCRAPIAWRSSTPTRSAPMRRSAPTPTSSTCSTSARWPCRGRSATTVSRAARR